MSDRPEPMGGFEFIRRKLEIHQLKKDIKELKKGEDSAENREEIRRLEWELAEHEKRLKEADDADREIRRIKREGPSGNDDWQAEYRRRMALLDGEGDFQPDFGPNFISGLMALLAGNYDESMKQLLKSFSSRELKEKQIAREYLVLMRRDRMDLFRYWTSKYPELLQEYEALLDKEYRLIGKEQTVTKLVEGIRKPQSALSKGEYQVRSAQEFKSASEKIQAMFPNDPELVAELIERLKSVLFEGEE